MKRMTAALILTILSCISNKAATALCIYNGKFNVKTSLRQEYRDSRWVVLVKVVAESSGQPSDGDGWGLYKVETLTSFKGSPPVEIQVFSFNDSGRFMMGSEMGKPYLGARYLLFLNPIAMTSSYPPIAAGSTEVNYSCGQSRRWRAVNQAGRAELRGLSRTATSSKKSIRP